MTPEERQRRFDEINRELVEIRRNKLIPGGFSEQESELLKELELLAYEEGADQFLDLPIMDEKVLRGPERTKTGVPFMITIVMRAQLQALGHSSDEIAKMKPAEAWKILDAARGH